MEPEKLDELLKKIVLNKELENQLDVQQSEVLWNRMQMELTKPKTLLWKSAAIILILLNSFLFLYSFRTFRENELLHSELKNRSAYYSPPITISDSPLPSEIISENKKQPAQIDIQLKTDTIRLVEYREKIVIQPQEDLSGRLHEIDSLKNIIHMKNEEILALSEKTKKTDDQFNKPDNYVVAFNENNEVKKSSLNKEQGLKFQLSLISIK